MGSTICTAGFPSAAIASSCLTARCDSIWYGFFIATLLFSAKENSLSAYQGWERGVATFYDLPGIPRPATADATRRPIKYSMRVLEACRGLRHGSSSDQPSPDAKSERTFALKQN